MKNYRATNRKLVKSHVMGCRTRCFRGRQWQPGSFFTMAHIGHATFFLFVTLFLFSVVVVIVDRAIKSNYRVINYCAINEKLSRDK